MKEGESGAGGGEWRGSWRVEGESVGGGENGGGGGEWRGKGRVEGEGESGGGGGEWRVEGEWRGRGRTEGEESGRWKEEWSLGDGEDSGVHGGQEGESEK